MADESSKKRRRRVPLSCLFCRKRKIKCDRIRPVCGSCMANGAPSSCVYEDPYWLEDGDDGQSSQYKVAAIHPIGLISMGGASGNGMSQESGESDRHDSFANESRRQLEIPNHQLNQFRIEAVSRQAQATTANKQKKKGTKLPRLGVGLATAESYDTDKIEMTSFQVPKDHRERATTPEAFTTPSLAMGSSSSLETPYLDCDNVVVDFHKGMVSIRYRKHNLKINNLGPLSASSFLQKDFYGRILFNNMLRFRSLNQQHTKPAKAKRKKPKDNKRCLHQSIEELVQQRKNGGFLGLKPEDDAEGMKSLQKAIVLILPPKNVIHIYVDRFFKFVYPFYPLIDEETFRADLQKSLGPWGNDTLDLKLEGKPEVFTIALIMTILKLSFLTVYSYKAQPEDTLPEEVKLSLQHPIGPEYLSLIKTCVNKFNFLKKTGLGIVQLLYYLRIYNSLGYEEHDGAGGSESNILTGVIFQSANFIGLHRDPVDNMINFRDSAQKNVKLLQLWRKAWFTLVDMDIEQTMNRNSILSLNLDYSDTKYPDYQELVNASNIFDLNIEKDVIDNIVRKNELNIVITRLLNNILKIRSPPTIGMLKKDLVLVETFMKNNFRSYEDFINDLQALKAMKSHRYHHVPSTNKVRKIRQFISLAEFVFTVKYHIFLELESRGPKYAAEAWNYHLELFQLSAEAICICKFWLVHGPDYISDYNSFQYMFSAVYTHAFRKFGQFYCSFLIRIISSKYRLLKTHASRIKALENLEFLHKLFLRGAEYLASSCFVVTNFSNDYYVSHKGRDILKYCFRCINDHSTEKEFSVHNIFRNGVADEASCKNLFNENSKNFHFEKFRILLNIFDKYDRLTKKLNNDVILENNKVGGVSQRTSYSRFRSLVSILNDGDRLKQAQGSSQSSFFNLTAGLSPGSLETSPMSTADFYSHDGPLTANDIENYWKFLESKDPSDRYGQQMDIGCYQNPIQPAVSAAASATPILSALPQASVARQPSPMFDPLSAPVNDHNFANYDMGNPPYGNFNNGVGNDSSRNITVPPDRGLNLDNLVLSDSYNNQTDGMNFIDDILRMNDEALDMFEMGDVELGTFFV